MSAQSITNSFVPNPPAFTESFFEPQPKPISPLSDKNRNVDGNPVELNPIDKADLNFLIPNLSSSELENYNQFLIECVNKHSYEKTFFGTVCTGHPDASCPYPGLPPENPHADKSVLTQFVKKGLSKSFREEEKNFKIDFQNWQARLNAHILEVPQLQSKDYTFKAYVALVQNNPSEAISLAEEALTLHAFNPEAIAILSIAYLQNGDFDSSLYFEEKLDQITPPLPLNATGQILLENIIQVALRETYIEACQGALNQLEINSSVIPLENSFLKNMIQNQMELCKNNLFGLPGHDFLDLIGLHFIDAMVRNPQDSSTPFSESIEIAFPHLAAMFDGFEKNLILIIDNDMLSKFESLQELTDPEFNPATKDKTWIRQVIKDLSQPITFGDRAFKRSFMMNAIKIQTEKALFEMDIAQAK
ncbi:MAG: hypothetical protein S4CHLAM7_10610 [Chlamydiae bacterium]|nr:hypothetical protein [Chlamydiota bacterium]